MARDLEGIVVVVTGAASGIGRAAAVELAARGASLVLTSRRREALETVALRCRELGASTLVVPADVTSAEELEGVGARAQEEFGRIDAWVNNAAITLFGRVEETPFEVFERVIDTNLLGYVRGARVALPRFREQGYGTLVNVSSVVAETTQPYTSAYGMTKAAIRSFGQALRMELSLDGAAGIRVCTILPASIDTPLFQQAGNYTGRRVKAMSPVYPAAQVARAIGDAITRPRREVVVGAAGRVFLLFRRLFPGAYERIAARKVDRDHFTEEAAPPTDGNAWEPRPEYAQVSGGWRLGSRTGPRSSAWWLLAGAAVGIPILAGWRYAKNGELPRSTDDRRSDSDRTREGARRGGILPPLLRRVRGPGEGNGRRDGADGAAGKRGRRRALAGS